MSDQQMRTGAVINPADDRGPQGGGKSWSPAVQLMGAGEGMPVELVYRKSWALLGYLACESERRHARTALAVLFWPQLPEVAAMTNLRQVLCNLNRYCKATLGEGVLRVERNAVALRRQGRSLFDIDLPAVSAGTISRLLREQRVFLAGMDDVAGLDFRTWLEVARQTIDGELVGAAEKCCDQMLAESRWDEALALARALLQRDAWNELHVRRVMRACAASGMRTAAIDVYERTRQLLLKDLGIEPEEETRNLLAKIRADSVTLRAPHSSETKAADDTAGRRLPLVV